MIATSEVQTAQECFTDYVKHSDSIEEVALSCRVQTQTVFAWREGRWPRGEQLYRLWAFLEFKGYRLVELEALSRPVHQLLLAIGRGDLSFEEVQLELGYSNPQSLYRLFLHGTGLAKERAWRLEQLVERYRPSTQANQDILAPQELSSFTIESVKQDLSEETIQPMQSEQSSLARLLRLVVKRSGEVPAEELKRQLEGVPRQEVEAFALLLLEII